MSQQNITKEDSVDLQTKQGLRVLMISTDRKMFEEGSAVRERLIGYAQFLDRLDVIVFSTKEHGTPSGTIQVSENIFLHATNSANRWLYIQDAVKLGKQVLKSTDSGLLTTDFVITTQDPFETGWVGLNLSKKFHIPFHIQIHTDFLSPYFAKSFLNKIRLHMASKTLPQADGIRVVSQRIANSLKAISYKLKATPKVLPIFIDAEMIENIPPTFDLKLKYPQFQKIILVASRLEKEKDIDTALVAFKEVSRHNPNTGLVIVGDGSEREALELKAKSYKLSANVIFEGWQNDLNSYYKGADVFLNTSFYEGYGMTLIEASLNKKPIVTTDVGIAGEGNLLLHTQHALVCPAGDSGCIAGYLNSFLKDLNGARAMGLRAYTKIGGEVLGKDKYYKEIVGDWTKLF